MSYRIRSYRFIIFLAVILVALTGIFFLSRTPSDRSFLLNDHWSPLNQALANQHRNWSYASYHGQSVTSMFYSETTKVTILMFHEIKNPPSEISVPPENFEKQMKYLYEHGFNAITLDDFYDFRNNKKPLPPKPIIITFDDGYRDNYTNAFPVLKKYGFKGTVFIITGAVGKDNYLTWNMIREMYNSGLVELGAHTVNHYILSEISPVDAQSEITMSRSIIEKETGAKPTFFSYPLGKNNPEVVKAVQLEGYKGAVIMGNGTGDNRNNNNSNLLLLSRTFVGGNYNIKTFAQRVKN